MLKAKLFSFAIACTVGIFGFIPIAAFAAETDTESVTLSENNQKEKKAAFEEKIKKASDKWNTLTTQQKKEIYDLIEKKMQAENKIMDKLVELGVMEKEDAEQMKAHMSSNFKKVKESGEFPLLRHKGKKSRNN